jgi:hypothetical protein
MEELRAWIPMADGVRLAARLFLPDGLPAAVLLEALPYRMDDLTASYASEYERLRDEGGFAVCRLDLRGTGSSEGLALDEYHPQEQADLCGAIAWLAAQEWSTGRVGMYGTSWSGFNSLQVAMERPPALGAIVSIYASDDRYTDDVHYMGGILKALDLVDWELYMAASNALPPVPAVYGEGWREEWQRRLDVEPWLLRWLEEQADGPYWRHGSLRPLYERIACPTMLVAGWADGYTNIAFRALERLSCPRRVVVGPWAHMSPATSIPGPHVDLVPELVRWFSRWLRDERNGVDEEPALAVFARRSTRPARDVAEMRGEWRHEPTWPPERLRERTLRPDGDGIDRVAVEGDVGVAAWISCASVGAPGRPARRRCPLAHLRLAARGGARAARPPAPTAPDHRAAPGLLPLGSTLRRLPRRRVRARLPRRPQPRPPQRSRNAGAARAGRPDRGRAGARGDGVDVRSRASAATLAGGLGLAEHLAAAARWYWTARPSHVRHASRPRTHATAPRAATAGRQPSSASSRTRRRRESSRPTAPTTRRRSRRASRSATRARSASTGATRAGPGCGPRAGTGSRGPSRPSPPKRGSTSAPRPRRTRSCSRSSRRRATAERAASSGGTSGESRVGSSRHVSAGHLVGREARRHHREMLRRRKPLMSPEELRGALLLLMSIASNVEAIRREIVGDGGEETERE